MNRRELLTGAIFGGCGGYFLSKYHINGYAGSSDKESKPLLSFYPITHYNDLFLLFTHVGQTLAPRLRALPEYKNREREIFYALEEIGFFDYGNDFAARMWSHFNVTNMIISPDPKVSKSLLVSCISSYPKGWASIIHKMYTHSPEITLGVYNKAHLHV